MMRRRQQQQQQQEEHQQGQPSPIWRCGTFALDASMPLHPLIMGILNVTPDSFSDGGRHDTPIAACDHARTLVQQGAAIIDVGGESTRPGSDEVGIDEELARVLPVVTQLAAEGLVVSIDTRHAPVAQACVAAGAAIINDVSGFRDPAMRAVAANCDAGLVVMHMLGEPKSMQGNPFYEDVVAEVGAYLLQQAGLLEAAGVAPERICIDPGPGFGKTCEHNLALLRETRSLASLGYPLMAAFSRKGFIGTITGVEIPRERIAGSVAVAALAASRGAHVLRVHDVAPTVEALKVLAAVREGIAR
ncbi:MAG: dihydropteroate synthase [Coriobacteriales bacterium]|jgi:dihydropteroate synthase|nr:dihydropteroate synthase [Coriobacteriales bacterium]